MRQICQIDLIQIQVGVRFDTVQRTKKSIMFTNGLSGYPTKSWRYTLPDSLRIVVIIL